MSQSSASLSTSLRYSSPLKSQRAQTHKSKHGGIPQPSFSPQKQYESTQKQLYEKIKTKYVDLTPVQRINDASSKTNTQPKGNYKVMTPRAYSNLKPRHIATDPSLMSTEFSPLPLNVSHNSTKSISNLRCGRRNTFFEFSNFKMSKVESSAGYTDHFTNFLDDALISVDHSIKHKKSIVHDNVSKLSHLRVQEDDNNQILKCNNELDKYITLESMANEQLLRSTKELTKEIIMARHQLELMKNKYTFEIKSMINDRNNLHKTCEEIQTSIVNDQKQFFEQQGREYQIIKNLHSKNIDRQQALGQFQHQHHVERQSEDQKIKTLANKQLLLSKLVREAKVKLETQGGSKYKKVKRGSSYNSISNNIKQKSLTQTFN